MQLQKLGQKEMLKKREIAKNNKLNYLEIFKFKDINDVINQINLYINNSK